LNNIQQNHSELLQNLLSYSTVNQEYITEINGIIQSGIPNTPDPNTYYKYDTEKLINSVIEDTTLRNTLDVANDDMQNLLLHQNTMYITGTIACATLIISAIFFARNK
jgi:hypothetical protein